MHTLTAQDYERFGHFASAAESIGMRHLAQQYRIAGCKGSIDETEYAFLYGPVAREIALHIPHPTDDV